LIAPRSIWTGGGFRLIVEVESMVVLLVRRNDGDGRTSVVSFSDSRIRA